MQDRVAQRGECASGHAAVNEQVPPCQHQQKLVLLGNPRRLHGSETLIQHRLPCSEGPRRSPHSPFNPATRLLSRLVGPANPHIHHTSRVMGARTCGRRCTAARAPAPARPRLLLRSLALPRTPLGPSRGPALSAAARPRTVCTAMPRASPPSSPTPQPAKSAGPTAAATAAPAPAAGLPVAGPTPAVAPVPDASAEAFSWTACWYPVLPLSYLDPRRPNGPVEILGRRYVAWFDAAAARWRCFEDRCPHRGAALSQGRVVGGGAALQCAYHGWEFTGASGACGRIPQVRPPPLGRGGRAARARLPAWVARRLTAGELLMPPQPSSPGPSHRLPVGPSPHLVQPAPPSIDSARRR
jgi:nitrite reductase/ring-hydroxylating ferredoxin subunit